FRCAGAPMNSPSEASWQNQRTSREWGPEVVTVISQSDVISPLKYARPRRGPPLRPLVGPLIAVIQWKGYTGQDSRAWNRAERTTRHEGLAFPQGAFRQGNARRPGRRVEGPGGARAPGLGTLRRDGRCVGR